MLKLFCLRAGTMISRIKQHYFSNTYLYTLIATVVLLIMVFSAWYTMLQRAQSFDSRLHHLYDLQINSLQQLIYDAERQAIMASQLVASDQQIKQQLLQASGYYQQQAAATDLTILRQQVLPLLDHYWQALVPYGVSQLHCI